MKKCNVSIVGATGLVGSTLLSILKERNFPIDTLYLLASKRSEGEILNFNGKDIKVLNVDDFDFRKSQIAFFCASNSVAAKYAPDAARLGNIVIDKSSYFRKDPQIPLVVPEVNAHLLKNFTHGIISSPNCSTIPLVLALKPIYEAVGIKKLNIATYQSVSGTGKEAITELLEQSRAFLQGQTCLPQIYPQVIAFNLFPHCDDFLENGYTQEEMKLVLEIKKIFSDDAIAINPTAVRVPVFYGHSAAVHIETQHVISIDRVYACLENAPSIQLNSGEFPYATPAMDAAGKDCVYVGRIRKDLSHDHGINLWVVADNIRKGAALNAVQIAEHLMHLNLTKVSLPC